MHVMGYVRSPWLPVAFATAASSDHPASRRVPAAPGPMVFLPIDALSAVRPPLTARCCSCRPMPSARPYSIRRRALLLAARRPTVRLARCAPAVSAVSTFLHADRPKLGRRFFSPPAVRPSGLSAVSPPCQPTQCFFSPIARASSRQPAARPSVLPAVSPPYQPTRHLILLIARSSAVASSRRPPSNPSFIVNNKKLLQAHVDGAKLGDVTMCHAL